MASTVSVQVRRLARWLGGFEPLVLLAIALIVAAAWGFISLADEVIEGELHATDRKVVRSMRQADDPAAPIGPLWVQEMGRDATALGGNGFILLLTLVVTGFLLMSNRRATAVFMVIAVTGGYLVSQVLKAIISRPRPEIVPHLSHVHTFSFPSGHAMISAVVYLTLGAITATVVGRRRLKWYVLSVALLLTLIVGVSRVYLGVHYPTDVLAGWIAGLAWALLCWVVARLLQRRGQIEPTSRDQPKNEDVTQPR